MRKKISFVVLSNSGSSIKQLTISATFLRLFIFAFLISLGIFGFDYYNLKTAGIDTVERDIRIANQLDEITHQRKQIQDFAEEISDLKASLLDLNDFEKKIRIIANIEKPEDQEGLFGVGGSIPEDLDTQVPLTQKHNSLLRGMHEQVAELNLASINQKQSFESLFRYLKDRQNLLASTPAVRPSPGWTTSRFGYRTSPFTGRREFHKGYDIANRHGTPIIATADGVITFTGSKGFLGNVIVIDHGHGMITRYGHCHKLLVKRGDAVKRGDTIALMGNTGRSTGPHLHYEVHLNGLPVNPEKYILN
ncbi:MAG: M23 family metallopeptidase [Deltaproteobacteria bacterium]|nr:MAG: M23 family metallopeptidase [Deltaproteobacteria bacterium]